MTVQQVTEFFTMGSLDKFVQTSVEISRQQALSIFAGIAAGMAHIHKEGIVHRDLAARNVLCRQIFAILRPTGAFAKGGQCCGCKGCRLLTFQVTNNGRLKLTMYSTG